MKKNIAVIFIHSRAYVKGESKKAAMQELLCKNRAKKLGCLTKVFIENTLALKLIDRPYLQEALKYCKSNREKILTFMVIDKSKISEIPDELQKIEEMIKGYRIELVSIY